MAFVKIPRGASRRRRTWKQELTRGAATIIITQQGCCEMLLWFLNQKCVSLSYVAMMMMCTLKPLSFRTPDELKIQRLPGRQKRKDCWPCSCIIMHSFIIIFATFQAAPFQYHFFNNYTGAVDSLYSVWTAAETSFWPFIYDSNPKGQFTLKYFLSRIVPSWLLKGKDIIIALKIL